MKKIFYFVSFCTVVISCDLKPGNDVKADNDTAKNATPAIVNAPAPVQQNPQPATQQSPVINSTLNGSVYGTWVLQAYNGTIQDFADYPSGMPYIRIDSATKKISGSTSCNGINGSFEVTGNEILFSTITKTNNPCNIRAEEAIISFFSGKRQSFEFVEGVLYFRGSEGKNFTFRKIQ